MPEQNVSKADLARGVNKSRAWVTQLLGGNANMTIRTLAEVLYALDAEVKLHARPLSWKGDAIGEWFIDIFERLGGDLASGGSQSRMRWTLFLMGGLRTMVNPADRESYTVFRLVGGSFN